MWGFFFLVYFHYIRNMKILENRVNAAGVGTLIFEFDGYVYSLGETMDLDDGENLGPFNWFKRTKIGRAHV